VQQTTGQQKIKFKHLT
jgi:hypothetical protein